MIKKSRLVSAKAAILATLAYDHPKEINTIVQEVNAYLPKRIRSEIFGLWGDSLTTQRAYKMLCQLEKKGLVKVEYRGKGTEEYPVYTKKRNGLHERNPLLWWFSRVEMVPC